MLVTPAYLPVSRQRSPPRRLSSHGVKQLPSQLELLKVSLPEMEAEFGPDNPYMQGEKVQTAQLEKQPADNAPVNRK